MRIAIVGAGVSGLVVAHRLHERHDVTVFAQAPKAGGHTNSVRVDVADETHHVDTGFIVHNDRNYPRFEALLERLGVATQPSVMSFGVADTRGDFEYSSASANGLFASARSTPRSRCTGARSRGARSARRRCATPRARSARSCSSTATPSGSGCAGSPSSLPRAAQTERAARRLALALLRRIQEGRLTIVEDGRPTVIGRGAPQATVVVRSPRFWPMLLRGGLGFGEAYVEGHWDTPDLTAVIELAARNLGGVDELRRRLTPVREPLQRGRALLTRNTPSRARSGIAAHYDLGNDLFSAMLDETMTYSCAVFERRDTSLADAQMAKLERICDKLAIDPGDRVLEIGTGWGSFALHAAATRGCHVTTTTLSQEQYGLAIARVADAGLSDRVTVLRDDYRELRGTFDKLVCIEMIEAVGWKDFGTFFEICARRLEPNGAMALQAITVDDRLYAMEKASRTFIRTHVFPDGCLPSLEVIARSVARRSDLRMVALEEITAHHPETLRRWRENLDANAAELAARGYDDRFQRLWRLYLCWCELGFAMRRISDVQIVLGKPAWRGTVSVSDSRARTHCTARPPGRATGSRSTP